VLSFARPLDFDSTGAPVSCEKQAKYLGERFNTRESILSGRHNKTIEKKVVDKQVVFTQEYIH